MATTLFSQRNPALTVTFHAVGSLRWSARNSPTAHPVELGVDVTDHIQEQADQYFLTDAIVSGAPFLPQAPMTKGLVLERLRTIRSLGLVTLVTVELGSIANLAIATLDLDKDVLDRHRYNISLTRVRIANAVAVQIPASAPPADLDAASEFPDEVDVGDQPTTVPTAPVKQSLLSTGASLLGLGG